MRRARHLASASARPKATWLAALGMICAAALAWPVAGTAQDATTLAARVAKLERQLDSQGLVELLREFETLREQLRHLQGALEEQGHALEQMRKVQRDTYADLDQRLAALQPAAPGVAPEPPLPMSAAPAGQSVAGAPAEQSMALDIETSGIGPRLNDPATLLQREAAAADAQAAAARAADAAMGTGAIDTGAVPVPPVTGSLAAASPPPGSMVVTPAMPQPSPPSPAPAATVDSPQSEAAYRDAFTLLKAGQYEQAIAAFNAYLTQYPASQYNDNAQYWLGEAYYVMGQYEPAIAQYQKVVTGYPDSQKQSHALLKIAYSYDELGQDQQATKVLVELKQRFPGSAAARLADERLQRIGAAGPVQ